MRASLSLVVVALASVAATAAMTRPAQNRAPQPARPAREAFDLTALAQAAAEEGRGWTQFLDRPTLRCGLYRLPAGGTDGQSPHDEDEVYHVVKGRAVLVVDGEPVPVAPGSVVFVAAEVEHRFVDIEEDLEVLVFFSRAPIGDREPEER